MVKQTYSEFESDSGLAAFKVSKKRYLDQNQHVSFGYIATSSVIMHTAESSEACVLLIQRAASDSDPNLWEPPGGACDDDDLSILHAAAREVREEAGLYVSRFSRLLEPSHLFDLSDGKKVCQFNFVAYVNADGNTPPAVKLDPNEHQNSVWATENEVKAKKVGDIELKFTRDEVEQNVLQAFQHTNERST